MFLMLPLKLSVCVLCDVPYVWWTCDVSKCVSCMSQDVGLNVHCTIASILFHCVECSYIILCRSVLGEEVTAQEQTKSTGL